MAVGQEDVVDAEDLIGSFANVEADIQRGHGNDRFLAANRMADELQGIERKM